MKRPNAGSGSSSPIGTKKYDSYQHGGPARPGYQAPIFYAADQTQTLEEATKTYYQADETSGNILNTLTAQRQQLSKAGENVWQMRTTTENAKKQLEELRKKYRQKKQRLYMWIAGLAFVDILLFVRILQCHGNFYCL